MFLQVEVPMKASEKRTVLFVDKSKNIRPDFIESMSDHFCSRSITFNDPSLTQEKLAYDCLFYYTERFDPHTMEELTFLYEKKENPKSPMLLLHEKASERDLLPYLSLPLNGIVSLTYLQENPKIIFQHIEKKGIFLEPHLHWDLVSEIERKKIKDTPIERLVLNQAKVKTILRENEKDVLQLILDGCNNREIAQTLYLAPSTVSTVISQLLRKLQANDRTDAMVKAIRRGWVDAER